MPHYRSLPATPRNATKAPIYPKFLGLSLVVAAAACGGSVVDGEGGTSGTAPPDGDIAPAYDSGAAGSAGSGAGGVGGEAGFDAGDAQDELPPLQGEAPDPFDGGMDAWVDVIDGGVGDAASPGYAPDPYDAACETSVPVDDSGA